MTRVWEAIRAGGVEIRLNFYNTAVKFVMNSSKGHFHVGGENLVGSLVTMQSLQFGPIMKSLRDLLQNVLLGRSVLQPVHLPKSLSVAHPNSLQVWKEE